MGTLTNESRKCPVLVQGKWFVAPNLCFLRLAFAIALCVKDEDSCGISLPLPVKLLLRLCSLLRARTHVVCVHVVAYFRTVCNLSASVRCHARTCRASGLRIQAGVDL